MDFKRHPTPGQGYGFGPRGNAGGNTSYGSHGGYPNYTPHHAHAHGHSHSHPTHSQHNVRGYKSNDMHSGRLNLVHSYRNLINLHGDINSERIHVFRALNQSRDEFLNTLSYFTRRYQDDALDILLAEVQFQIENLKNEIPVVDEAGGKSQLPSPSSTSDSNETQSVPDKSYTFLMEKFAAFEGYLIQLKNQSLEQMKMIMNEVSLFQGRDHTLLEQLANRERRLEKDFVEFFSDAERQIMDVEKKNHAQLLTRLRNAERDLNSRDQKILQLEETARMLNDRNEKLMAELQQVNADHQFEKLQLYHHVEVCKFNAKCLAMDELSRFFKWKLCVCGRAYDSDLLREIDTQFNNNGFGCASTSSELLYPKNTLPHTIGEQKELPLHFTGSWCLPLPLTIPFPSIATAPPQPIPTGSFTPAEEAANKGTVVNDLRDRYDDLQLKAAAMPNYEDVRMMIMKIVCHFKMGDLRVCEEMGGKKFVSSLFYCNPGDLIPTANGENIFSTGYGDTPEQATAKSVKKAYDEILRLENTNSLEDKEMDLTFVRKSQSLSDKEAFNEEPVRMTLVRSFCRDKTKDRNCFQEAHLYKNQASLKEKYMADWKIHARVEDKDLLQIKEKLKEIFVALSESNINDFMGPPEDTKKPMGDGEENASKSNSELS